MSDRMLELVGPLTIILLDGIDVAILLVIGLAYLGQGV